MQTYQQIFQLIQEKLPTGVSPEITAEEHQEVEMAILDFARDQWLPGDIKEVDCTNQYIADNFDSNGIGINERVGWAICNGYNNLTRNRTGRVSVGYGTVLPYEFGAATTFPSMGTGSGSTFTPVIDGNKNSVVINHTHDYTTYPATNEANGTRRTNAEVRTSFVESETSSEGVSGTDKNMQPYIVTLFIQKISNP